MTISVWTLLVLLGISGSFGVIFGCVMASRPTWVEGTGGRRRPQSVVNLADQR